MMIEYPESVKAALEPQGPTPPLADFITAYAEDSNLPWRLEHGHINNLLDSAIERIEELENALTALLATDATHAIRAALTPNQTAWSELAAKMMAINHAAQLLGVPIKAVTQQQSKEQDNGSLTEQGRERIADEGSAGPDEDHGGPGLGRPDH